MYILTPNSTLECATHVLDSSVAEFLTRKLSGLIPSPATNLLFLIQYMYISPAYPSLQLKYNLWPLITLTPSSGCFSNRSLIPSLMHSSALWRWWFSFTTITSFLCHLFHAFTHLLFANDLENCLLGVVMSQVISSCTGSVNTPPWSEHITKPRMIF